MKDVETIESAFNDMLTGRLNSRKNYACQYLAQAKALFNKVGLTCVDTFMKFIASQISMMRVCSDLVLCVMI